MERLWLGRPVNPSLHLPCPALHPCAGKSTLLNAIMGSNFLPNTNVPETAAIVMVKDDPHATEPMIYAAAPDGGEVVVARGQCAVREYLRQRNADVRSQRGNPNTSPDANAAQASAAQSGSRSQPLLGMDSLHIINIRTRLPAAAGHAGAAQAHNPRLVLLDTPGPNEAGAEHLKAQVSTCHGACTTVPQKKYV